MPHARFPKENHLPDLIRRDNQVKKIDRVEQQTRSSRAKEPNHLVADSV